MKFAIAIATGVLAMTSAADAQPARTHVEHFPAQPINATTPAPFSTAVRVGDILYLSGAIGLGPNGLPEGIEAQTKLMMDYIGTVLKRAGRGWGDVFKCTVMLDNMADWQAFNAVYVPYFPAGKLPARSAFGADGLALGALVELECMAYAGKPGKGG